MLCYRPKHFLSVCCQPTGLFFPNAQRIYEVISGSSRSYYTSCPLISASVFLSSACSLYPTSGVPCLGLWKWIAWLSEGGQWKGERSRLRTHLAELLLWVAPVWSTEFRLHRLVLADFHRTQRQRLDLERKAKRGHLYVLCSWTTAHHNIALYPERQWFMVTFQAWLA